MDLLFRSEPVGGLREFLFLLFLSCRIDFDTLPDSTFSKLVFCVILTVYFSEPSSSSW